MSVISPALLVVSKARSLRPFRVVNARAYSDAALPRQGSSLQDSTTCNEALKRCFRSRHGTVPPRCAPGSGRASTPPAVSPREARPPPPWAGAPGTQPISPPADRRWFRVSGATRVASPQQQTVGAYAGPASHSGSANIVSGASGERAGWRHMHRAAAPGRNSKNTADWRGNARPRWRRSLKPIDPGPKPGFLFRLPLLTKMSCRTAEVADVEGAQDNRLR